MNNYFYRPSLSFALCLGLIVGTLSPLQAAKDEVECSVIFRNITNETERNRIEALIDQKSSNTYSVVGQDKEREYTFKVTTLADFHELHRALLYEKPKDPEDDSLGRKRQNLDIMKVIAEYNTVDLVMSIEVTVTIQITPGARLFVLDAELKEKEMTREVNAQGKISFPTKVTKGQDYIYARTELNGVDRYLRINIFSGGQMEIQPDAYLSGMTT